MVRISEQLIDEIAEAVRDRGRLSKEEVLQGWSLTEELYDSLRPVILRRPGIDSGSRRGGFVVRRRGGPLPAESESEQLVLQDGWEQAAVDRLCDLLRHRALEDLLGSLQYTIRQIRRHRTGVDRRGTKRELAAALLIQHSQDLLRQPPIRKAIAAATGVRSPGRWVAGKAAAVTFTQQTGFPIELAGTPSPESRPSSELLSGRVELPPLWGFQNEVHRELLNRLYRPGDRALVTLPTGAGKTRVAVDSIRCWLNDRFNQQKGVAERGLALWLAHTEELCEQAYECFKQVWEAERQRSQLLLVRFWGGYTRTRGEIDETLSQAQLLPSVLVSTPNRIVNLIRGNIEGGEEVLRSLCDATGLVVIDEAHRAAARSYRQIIDTFSHATHRVSVIGLTATPFRMEYLEEDADSGTIELREIFRELIEARETLGSDPRSELQRRGVLATPCFETLQTTTSLRIPGFHEQELDLEAGIERIDQILAQRTDSSTRRIVLLERLQQVAAEPGSSVLYFGPSVHDAECMAYLLRASGIDSAVVSGTTRDTVRRQTINDFKDRRIKVLCNCQVLTTGFDAPKVSHLFMARPTVSQVLYEQMVGRGLRGARFGGTEVCTIIDCRDNFRGPRPELGYEAFRRVWGST